ncbi:MAG TPA: hypothetical protein VHN98_04535 [Acidimicrobiales bacterium]|nr:hypothetical protein [Acidimicrobiales bacterium]
MPQWMSMEVFDASGSAASWADAHGDALTEAALLHGAVDWVWHRAPWGVIFEIAFKDDAAWESFRSSSAVQAALDAVPDPVGGLLIYRGRGGSSGSRDPRKPRPLLGSGAAALPLPLTEELGIHVFAPPTDQRSSRLLVLG